MAMQEEERPYKCPECPKSFPSGKALFGHLRTHPVRSCPPPKASLMVKLVPRRLTLREKMELYYHHWDTESYYEGDGGDYTKRYLEGLERERKMQRRILSCQERQDPMPAMAMKEKILKPAKVDEEKVDEARRVKARIVTLLTATATATATGSKKKKIGEVADKIKEYYECEICVKRFGSHQALGGHMTCHRNIIKTSSFSAADGKDAGEPKTFVCKFCDGVFVTGQALGGHMRKHLTVTDVFLAAAAPTVAPGPSLAAEVVPNSAISDASLASPNCSVPTSSSGVEEASTVTIDYQGSGTLDLQLKLQLGPSVDR